MIDKKPGLIARCVDTADVINAVNFARDNDLLISIRGGGTMSEGWVYAMMVLQSIFR
jgi:FAD/FMN-containing dehydrogenase